MALLIDGAAFSGGLFDVLPIDRPVKMNNEKPDHGGGPASVREGATSEIADHKDDIFFAAISTTRMPMLVTDPRQQDNPIVFANPAFMAMSGYPSDEVIGHNCRFLQGAATDPQTVQSIRSAIAERREITTEILNYRKDGSSFWNALFISPVFNQRQELVYFFASQLDVSRRRDAEDALAQAQKMEALGQLTGGISHDFNNLLQVMSGHLDVLRVRTRNGSATDESTLQSVERIRDSVGKATTLTRQLLAFSRKQSLQGRVINLNAVAQGMSDLAQRTLGETVTVAFDLEASLPNCALDPTQLEVAVLNLLVNSRDAMPKGGRIVIATRSVEVLDEDRLSFAGLPAGRYVSLSVSDSGVGIPKEYQARVMDPFFTTKEEGKGTGLGLSSVYGFVKQSGGAVTLYSEVGTGTTVRLYFPATQDHLPSLRKPASSPIRRGGTETVLVVEDRPEVAEVARDMLEGLGYRVHLVHSAQEAVAWVNTRPREDWPELLFSDIVMPGGMNGYDLARELRRKVPGLKVLLTTGFDRDMVHSRDESAGEFSVLRKPYRMDELARKARSTLDGSTGSGR